MEDSSEDLPKPPRRTAARPFFSPRPEGVTGPLELSRRRGAQLFTPPGSSPGAPSAPAADKPTAPERDDDAEATPPSAVAAITSEPQTDEPYDVPVSDAAADWTLPPTRVTEETLDAESLLAQRNTMDDDHQLFVEQFEHEEIELTAGSATTVPDEHSIEVIAYDDANSLLKAAASEGERPQVDGLRIETTEFSFHGENERPLKIESFWATEPFGAAKADGDATSSAVEPREEREVEHAEMALDDAEASRGHDSHPLEWGNVDTMHRDAALPLADNTPPWVGRPTPTSSQSLEELKESEPWAVSPADAEPAAAEALPVEKPMQVESEADELTIERAASDEPAIGALAKDESDVEATPSHPVADALERIAARVRGGELEVASGSESSDAAALAAVLTALLRQPH